MAGAGVPKVVHQLRRARQLAAVIRDRYPVGASELVGWVEAFPEWEWGHLAGLAGLRGAPSTDTVALVVELLGQRTDEDLVALVGVVREALELPAPATGDEVRYNELVADRVSNVRLSLDGISERGVSFEARWLQGRIAELPPAGYRAGPWPGVPVEDLVAHDHTDARHCPRCGQEIAVGDSTGVEATDGQRWCATHHGDAFADVYGPEAGADAAARAARRLGDVEGSA